jgi:exosortase
VAPARPEAVLRGPSLAWREPAVIGFLAACAVLLVVYAPVLYRMTQNWIELSEDYGHAFLIVPLAAYFAWERRAKLRRTPLAPSWWGLAPLALGVLTLAVGRLGVEYTNMRIGFVLTLIGLVVLLLGRPVFRVLAFPLCFLFLMIPLPQSVVNVVAFPLQLIAADVAVDALHTLQIPALREGNIIHLAHAPLFVAEACSGLRSLMALITLGVVMAYFFHKTLAERAIIVLSAIPIAILVNAFRVTTTALLANRFGEGVTEGPIHEFQGLITFGLAFLLLMAEASLLARIWPRRWRAARAVPRGGR